MVTQFILFARFATAELKQDTLGIMMLKHKENINLNT